MKYRVQNIVNNEYLDDDVIFLLPNGEVGWFIRDGSYPHYRKFGHQEDFKVIDEDCERLQKQLDFAKQAMLSAAGFLTCNPNDMQEIYPDFCAEQWALDSINKGLKQIEELNK